MSGNVLRFQGLGRISLGAVIQELGGGNKGVQRSSLSRWPVGRDLKDVREA